MKCVKTVAACALVALALNAAPAFAQAKPNAQEAANLKLVSDWWREVLQALPTLDPAETEAALRKLAEARGIKPGVLIHATRVAVVGQAVSPGLFEVLELVGRDRVTERLRTFAS